jgi:hypothetical protein
MNTKSVLAAAALAAFSLPSLAGDELIQQPAPASSLTREEVRAELEQLRAADALPAINEASPSPLEADALAERARDMQPQQNSPAEDAIDPLRSEDELIGQSAQEGAAEHLMFVSPQGTVVIIEPLPDGLPEDGSLPFEHPAVPGDAR